MKILVHSANTVQTINICFFLLIELFPGCSILVGLAMHLAQVHATDVVTAVENFVCTKLESPLDTACSRLIQEFGPILIDGIYHKRTPDMLCHDVSYLLNRFQDRIKGGL